MMHKSRLYLLLAISWYTLGYAAYEEPKITIVIVIDQFAYSVLEKVRPFLTGGLRFLLEEGIFYANAHTAYAWSSTAPGHASLNTGTLPKDHGVIADSWYDEITGKRIVCDDDTAERAAVFGPQGLQPYGKSAQHLMLDGISDQLMLQKQCHRNYQVFAISGKSRSAIFAANKLGTAFWFDTKTGMFTSSKAYVDALPTWIQQFNKTIARRVPYTWNLQKPHMPCAYTAANKFNCKLCTKEAFIGATFTPQLNVEDPYERLMKTPFASHIVFDCARACLDANYCKGNRDKKICMWILPSNLDKLGHEHGPDCKEAIDTLYHLDRQLKLFMDAVNCKTKKRNVLWVLSTDHGAAPCPEQMQAEGYSSAYRILEDDLKNELNTELKKTFDVDDLIIDVNAGALSMNRSLYRSFDLNKRRAIRRHIIEYTERIPGVRKVWTTRSLYKLSVAPESVEQMFKNQLYPQRNSSFMIQTHPYSFITKRKTGITHRSPYNYDTHIPLVIYRRAYHQRKTIETRVTNTQLAPTLAHLLGVGKPSACMTEILPGIIFKEDPCF